MRWWGSGLLLFFLDLSAEPGAGEGPLAFDRAIADAQCFSGLLDAQAGVKAQADDLGGELVIFTEATDDVIKGQDLFGVVLTRQVDDVDGHAATGWAAALVAEAGTGVLDEDALHGLCGDGEEAGAVDLFQALVADEAGIGLVDQGGGLEGVVDAFAAHAGLRDGMQLVVDAREEDAALLVVTRGGGAEHARDIDAGELAVAGWGWGVRLAHTRTLPQRGQNGAWFSADGLFGVRGGPGQPAGLTHNTIGT